MCISAEDSRHRQQRGILCALRHSRVAIESDLIVAVRLLVDRDIEHGQWVVGPPHSCPPQVRHGFLHPALVDQRGSNVIFGNVISFGDLRRVRPQGDIVAPETHLPMQRNSQCQQDGRSAGRCHHRWNMPDFHQIRHTPADDYENPQQRDIGVAVGHSVNPNLHQSDHRHQRSQKPEPPDKKRTPPPEDHGQSRDRDDCAGRQRRRGDADPKLGMRIHQRQIDRPEGLSQILDIGDRRISKVYPERKFQLGCGGCVRLHLHGDECARRRHRKPRYFLPNQTPERVATGGCDC